MSFSLGMPAINQKHRVRFPLITQFPHGKILNRGPIEGGPLFGWSIETLVRSPNGLQEKKMTNVAICPCHNSPVQVISDVNLIKTMTHIALKRSDGALVFGTCVPEAKTNERDPQSNSAYLEGDAVICKLSGERNYTKFKKGKEHALVIATFPPDPLFGLVPPSSIHSATAPKRGISPGFSRGLMVPLGGSFRDIRIQKTEISRERLVQTLETSVHTVFAEVDKGVLKNVTRLRDEFLFFKGKMPSLEEAKESESVRNRLLDREQKRKTNGFPDDDLRREGYSYTVRAWNCLVMRYEEALKAEQVEQQVREYNRSLSPSFLDENERLPYFFLLQILKNQQRENILRSFDEESIRQQILLYKLKQYEDQMEYLWEQRHSKKTTDLVINAKESYYQKLIECVDAERVKYQEYLRKLYFMLGI